MYPLLMEPISDADYKILQILLERGSSHLMFIKNIKLKVKFDDIIIVK